MEFFRRAPGQPRRLGVFPGAFNPPTRAHLSLAQAALSVVDEVVFVVPRVFPHKPYEGASFEQRVEMLKSAAANPRFSIAASAAGLFIEIARECREAYGPAIELYFLCGRDAADRIVNWDYGEPDAIRRQLAEYQLLVAPRGGPYEPPPGLRDRVHPLACAEDEISATAIRERIRTGGQWEHLVPGVIVGLVRKAYTAETQRSPG